MSKIGKRRRTAGSAPDHAHKTGSESRCAQELEEHRFLYDLAGAATPGQQHRRSPRTRSGRTDRQIHALTEVGCIRIFSDKKSGKNLREGDTLVVPSLDRLGRSIQDLIAIVSGLRKHVVGFTSLHEAHPRTHRAGHQ